MNVPPNKPAPAPATIKQPVWLAPHGAASLFVASTTVYSVYYLQMHLNHSLGVLPRTSPKPGHGQHARENTAFEGPFHPLWTWTGVAGSTFWNLPCNSLHLSKSLWKETKADLTLYIVSVLSTLQVTEYGLGTGFNPVRPLSYKAMADFIVTLHLSTMVATMSLVTLPCTVYNGNCIIKNWEPGGAIWIVIYSYLISLKNMCAQCTFVK